MVQTESGDRQARHLLKPPGAVTLVSLSTSAVSDQAFVTLATNDIYCQGALVLGQSLRNQRATRRLVVLITPQVSNLLR